GVGGRGRGRQRVGGGWGPGGDHGTRQRGPPAVPGVVGHRGCLGGPGAPAALYRAGPGRLDPGAGTRVCGLVRLAAAWGAAGAQRLARGRDGAGRRHFGRIGYGQGLGPRGAGGGLRGAGGAGGRLKAGKAGRSRRPPGRRGGRGRQAETARGPRMGRAKERCPGERTWWASWDRCPSTALGWARPWALPRAPRSAWCRRGAWGWIRRSFFRPRPW